MRLQLLHPVVAARSCEDCQRWLYDDAWKGDKFVFSSKINSRGKPPHDRKIERKEYPNVEAGSPPCKHCPKGSPENAKNLELSPKNLQAIEFYHQTKACGGRNLTDDAAADETLLANLTVIDSIYKAMERQQQNGLILNVLEAAVGLARS